jgi:soluble lytic murein transglycosylase-like protein
MTPINLGLSAADPADLELRHASERRDAERRAALRPAPDRRHGQRRRATWRHIAFTALTITFPHHLNLGLIALPASLVAPAPVSTVTVVVNSYVAVPARRAYDAYIREAARKYRVDVALIRSVIQTESRFNALAVSPAGARGLMQMMPATLRHLGVQDPFDPRENILAGTRYLRQMLDMHGGDVRLALAAYNAGPGNVFAYGDVPPFQETHDYIAKVTGLLYATP